jgi:hypothetical protein
VDEGRLTPCCQFASAEEVALDPDVYNCQSCVVAQAVNQLDGENLAAWELFQKVMTRFAAEQRVIGVWLGKIAEDMPTEDFEDLMMRLSILYHVHYPPPKESKRRGA